MLCRVCFGAVKAYVYQMARFPIWIKSRDARSSNQSAGREVTCAALGIRPFRAGWTAIAMVWTQNPPVRRLAHYSISDSADAQSEVTWGNSGPSWKAWSFSFFGHQASPLRYSSWPVPATDQNTPWPLSLSVIPTCPLPSHSRVYTRCDIRCHPQKAAFNHDDVSRVRNPGGGRGLGQLRRLGPRFAVRTRNGLALSPGSRQRQASRGCHCRRYHCRRR